MSGQSAKDTAKENNQTVQEVKETWHSAKDDEMAAGGLPERSINKVSDSDTGVELLGIFKSADMVPNSSDKKSE